MIMKKIEQIYPADMFFRRNLPIEVTRVIHSPGNFPEPDRIVHRREFWKVVYIVKGTGIFHINGRSYPFSAGFLYLSHPNDLTSLELTGEIILYNVLFRHESFTDDLKKLYGDYNFFSLFDREFNPEKSLNHELLHVLDANRNIFALIRKMERECELNDANTAEMLRYSLLELLIMLARQSAKTYNHRRKSEIIRFVDRYLEEHFRETVVPQLLADEIGISKGYLFTIYQKEKKCTIGEWLLQLRLTELKRLLLTGNTPIEKLCYRCGFSDLGNFYKVFSRELGMSPGEYRRKNRNPGSDNTRAENRNIQP